MLPETLRPRGFNLAAIKLILTWNMRDYDGIYQTLSNRIETIKALNQRGSVWNVRSMTQITVCLWNANTDEFSRPKASPEIGFWRERHFSADIFKSWLKRHKNNGCVQNEIRSYYLLNTMQQILHTDYYFTLSSAMLLMQPKKLLLKK